MIGLRIFSLPFCPEKGGFDDTPLQEYLAEGRALLDVQHHLLEPHGSPWMILLVKTRPLESSHPRQRQERQQAQEKRRNKEEWKASLVDEEARQRFELLEDWRRERAKEQGVPPFLLLNNRLLTKIAEHNPTSKTEFLKLNGFGNGKWERMGDELLSLLEAVKGNVS